MLFKRLTAAAAAVMCMVFFCTGTVSAADNDNSYVVTVYNERNGLPTGEANDVLQTSDGYIWIGSYGGLIRYDGSSFLNLSLEGIFPSSSVRALFEDHNGRLWIGTNDAGVFYLENGAVNSISSPDDNSFLCIRGFDESADGRIYAASNSGIAEIKDGALIPFTGEHMGGETVYSVSVDNYGRVWGALNSGILIAAENGVTKRVFTSEEFFDDIQAYCTAADSEGNIYLGSSGDKILKLSFPTESLEPEDILKTEISADEVFTHNSISRTSGGKMIVCGNTGACIISPDGTEIFLDSSKTASVNSGCVDYEGNIWLASASQGVIKYSKGYFGSPNGKAGISDISLNAVTKAGGTYYAATDSGLLAFDEDWQPISNQLTELYDGERVRSLFTDSKDDLWVASYSYTNTIACLSPDGNITVFNGDNGLINTSVRVITELSDGSIAAGTQGGVSIIRDGKVTENYGSDEGLEVCSVLCFLEAEDGALLVGSDGGGIYKIKDGAVTNYGFDEGLSEGVVLRMSKGPNNDRYFISAGSSLYCREREQFRKINIRKGAGSIFDIFVKDGMIWILQNNGILAYDEQRILDGEDVIPDEYSFEHGLTGSINANTWHFTDSDGRLYISTRNGISIFDFEPVKNILPKGIINNISVDGEQLGSPSELGLESSAGRMTIDFAALSYTGTTNVGISYMLEGFDEEETVIIGEKSGNVSYTNLPGGEYTFRLKIFDIGSEENFNEYELPISKEMKLYERPFFIPLTILLTIAASVGIVLLVSWIKIRNIRKRQHEYRSIIEQSLMTFARAIDAKDRYTNGHSLRVARYSAELAKRMGKSKLEQENIYYIALLHDIGKIGIPDSILRKPGKLTDEEREVIRQHPVIGGKILKNFSALEGIADGAKYHHERYDGTGYCEKLSGHDIPEVARIIGVADTYDAMSSNRIYIKAFSEDDIVKELKDCSGTQLDPDIVPIMLEMIKDGSAPIKLDPNETDTVFGDLAETEEKNEN